MIISIGDQISEQVYEEIKPLLGKKSDRFIASAYKLNIRHVAIVRRSLGIHVIKNVFEGDIENDEKYSALRAEVGIETDSSLARKFGVPRHVILKYRRKQGIDAVFKITKVDYDDADTEARISNAIISLGKATDIGISRDNKLPLPLVRRLRVEREIPSFLKSGADKRKEATFLTAEVKQKLLKVAGTKSDKVIGKEFNVSAAVVKVLRDQNNIRAFGSIPGVRQKITPELRSLLGTMPDGDLGELFGIHKKTIRGYRKKLGIPLFKDQAKNPQNQIQSEI